MANIGNLAVSLSLESIAFATGLSNSQKGLKQFVAGATAALAVATTAVEQVGGVAQGAFAWVKDGVDKVAEVGFAAQKLGVSTRFLSALQFEAGRHAEGLEHALNHLNVKLAEAAGGSTEATAAFRQLGLDGKHLADLGLEGAWKEISEKISHTADATERARAAHELFGREAGAELIPLLMKGAAGFREADAAARKMGYSVSTIDARKAEAAQRAMDSLGLAFEGIQRTAAIEFAPVLAGLAETAKDMIGQLGGGKAIFNEIADRLPDAILTSLKGAEGVAVAMADAASSVKQIADTIDGSSFQKWLAAKGGGYGAAAGAAFGFVTSGGAPTTNAGAALKAEIDPWIKELDDKMKGVAAAAKKAAAGAGAGKGAGGLADALAKRDEYLNTLDAQIAAFGMAGHAAERFKLAQSGLNDAQLAGVDAGLAQLRALERQEQKMKAMDAIADKARSSLDDSPLDKLRQEYDDLSKLSAAGGIGSAQMARILGKEYAGIGANMDKIAHPAAALEGSHEAYTSILRGEDMGRPQDVQKQLVEIAKRQEGLERQQVEQGRKIVEWFEKMKVKG